MHIVWKKTKRFQPSTQTCDTIGKLHFKECVKSKCVKIACLYELTAYMIGQLMYCSISRHIGGFIGIILYIIDECFQSLGTLARETSSIMNIMNV